MKTLISQQSKTLLCAMLGFMVVSCSTFAPVNYATGSTPSKTGRACSTYIFAAFPIDNVDLNADAIAKANSISNITSISSLDSKNYVVVSQNCITVKGN